MNLLQVGKTFSSHCSYLWDRAGTRSDLWHLATYWFGNLSEPDLWGYSFPALLEAHSHPVNQDTAATTKVLLISASLATMLLCLSIFHAGSFIWCFLLLGGLSLISFLILLFALFSLLLHWSLSLSLICSAFLLLLI